MAFLRHSAAVGLAIGVSFRNQNIKNNQDDWTSTHCVSDIRNRFIYHACIYTHSAMSKFCWVVSAEKKKENIKNNSVVMSDWNWKSQKKKQIRFKSWSWSLSTAVGKPHNDHSSIKILGPACVGARLTAVCSSLWLQAGSSGINFSSNLLRPVGREKYTEWPVCGIVVRGQSIYTFTIQQRHLW